MMFLAPHENPQTSIRLPNAEFGDAAGLVVDVKLKTAMDGTIRSTVKRTGNEKLQIAVRLDRLKAEELYEFIRYYSGEEWRIYLHDGSVWRAKLLTDPFQERFSLPGNAAIVTLDFEGVKIG